MQNLIKTYVWLLLCLLLPLNALRATVGGPVNVGYLVDYYFVHLDGNWQTAGTQGKISDWDVDSKAGTINFSYWNCLTITDSSTTGAIEMRKPFLPQTTGTISVEFKFLLPVKVDGMVWAIRADRNNSLIEFSTSGGAFGYTNTSGTFVPLIASYNANQSYAVHVDLTLPATSAVVYVNGAQLATGTSAFRSTSLTQAAQFYVATPVANTGVEQLYYLVITKGFKLYERFTNAAASIVPANWTATAAGGLASPQIIYGSSPKDIMSFRLDDTSTSAAAQLTRSFTSSTGKLVFEFKWMLPVKVDGATAQLRSGTTTAVKFTTTNSGLAYVNSSGTAVELWPNYKANLWYIVRVIANPTAQTADIYINGKLKGSAVPFNTSSTTLDNVLFTTSVANTGTLWVDDIYVYDFQPEPSDYVPAVQAVTSRGYMVGMQTFFYGWRDGHHCGWDWPYRYPNHDTPLGYFDNGKPEAMDWQLKWMAESGINFFLDCWYRNASGGQMKEPRPEYTEGPLHNGYFYAKYSDKVKFAIADYSLTNATEADFTTNVLPFWIEYYFKDARYYVIPGPTKGYPVVSFGGATTWINTANNAMKNSITALRAALAAEGFDGVVVLASYSGTSKTVMDNLYAAGIDYCYAYWGTNIIANTQATLVAQRDAGSFLKPIADGGQGQSGEAWDVVFTNGGYTSLSDFYSLSTWARDTFMTSSTLSGMVSSTMMLYDNWNEYGEGHYVCPTNLQGFGYLDQIRAAYTTTSTMSYAVPNATQKARINVLYTRGWEGRVWAFDSLYADTEGWTIQKQISTLSQTCGYLEGTTSGTDPSILSRDGYAIDASAYNQIKVRMKNSSAATSAKIYFITNSDATYTETKSKTFALTPNDPNYTEYTVDMSTVPGWVGTIRQLRFDPLESGALTGQTFSIDYIKVVWDGWYWGFDSATLGTEGWVTGYQVTSLVQNGGYMQGNVTGTDPSLLSPNGYAIDASIYKKIKVKMKNVTAGTKAKFYFITTTDTAYSESKAKAFTITPNDANYTEYVVDMSAVSTWTGAIKRLRFDVIDTGAASGDSFSIDYIKVCQ